MTPAIQRPAALGQQIAAIIRRRIIRGELQVGDRLTEESLAEEFSVSRGSVRDAIKQLTFENLVEIHRPRGIYITGLTVGDVTELYTLRSAIEKLALSRAMRVTEDERWKPCERSVNEMLKAATDGDHTSFLTADLDFHDQIYKLAGHQRVLAVWQQYLPTFTVLLEITINHDKDLLDAAHDHEALYRAMRGSDTEHALSILESHIDGAYKRMIQELSAQRALSA